MSSSVSAGLAATSSDVSNTALPGTSDNFISLRVEETTICSLVPSGCSTILSRKLGLDDHACSIVAKPGAEIVSTPLLSGIDEKAKCPSCPVRVEALK